MTSPPSTIDGATVAWVAYLTSAMTTGRTRHVVAGVEERDFAALAIAQYPSDSATYLFYCDAEWNAVTDTCHIDMAQAIAQAELEFGPLTFVEYQSAPVSDRVKPRFDFYDEVRIRITPQTVKHGLAGKLGAILGIAQPDHGNGPISYSVSIDGVKAGWQLREEELEPTGQRRKREDYYAGDSIRVSRHGRLLPD